jgi:hypothetical protein
MMALRALRVLRKPLIALTSAIFFFSLLAAADIVPLRGYGEVPVSQLSTRQIEEQLQVGCTIHLKYI